MPNASLVIANWKMNGNKALAKEMVTSLRDNQEQFRAVDVVVCPPFTLISDLTRECYYDDIAVGAQTVSEHESGAYTGEVSTSQLKEAGVSYVLVGHSERRQLFAESDEQINQKVKAILSANLKAVLCVGENKSQRDAGETWNVVSQQVRNALQGIAAESAGKIVVAYEPVWAIGTGETATPEQAQEVHEKLRAQVVELFGEVGNKLPLLYGGSVKPDNAKELFSQKDIDGGLIGGASLKTDDFLSICQAAQG
ncbi:triose-phosphate isomerase [Idiomarina sp.]|uniref:triose-phosphate isomerase n=1 Tax=Idiomarina sp. TaxID=1874361 RepID=UPI00261E4D67|nr:triose-phosphate isomerase [Idiomarina sp.]